MGLCCEFRGLGFVWCIVIWTIIENEKKKILRERLGQAYGAKKTLLLYAKIKRGLKCLNRPPINWEVHFQNKTFLLKIELPKLFV